MKIGKIRGVYGLCFHVSVGDFGKFRLVDFRVVHKLSVHQFDMAVGVFFDQRHFVRHQNNEFCFGYFFQNIHYFIGILRVEISRGFVRKNHVGAFDQRAGDCDSLLLSARKRVALLVFEALHIHKFQHFFAAAFDFLFVFKARKQHRVAHDFGDRIAAFEIIILEDKAYLLVADTIHVSAHRFAVYGDFTAVGFFQPAQNIEKRCFAAARFPEYRHQPFIGQIERNAFQHLISRRRMGVERLFDIFHANHYLDPLLKDLRIDCPLMFLLKPNATHSTISSSMNSTKK